MSDHDRVQTPPDVLLSRVDACRILGGISLPSLKRLIASGEIAVVKVGRRTMIETEELRSYIDRNRQRRGREAVASP